MESPDRNRFWHYTKFYIELINAEPNREGLARWLSREWRAVVIKQRVIVAEKERTVQL